MFGVILVCLLAVPPIFNLRLRNILLYNLDVPRSRLVKYPLLIKQIQKFTPEGHGDRPVLDEVLRILANILERVDRSTGLGRCRLVIAQLELPADGEMNPVLRGASTVICEGPLKTAQGLKLQCYLFDSGLVLCRQSSGNNRMTLYKPPLDAGRMKVTDLGTKVGRNNSFLPGSSSSSGLSTKHVFKVEAMDEDTVVTLVTFNEHNKKQWMLGLHRAVEQRQQPPPETKETIDCGRPKEVPKIKANLEIRGSHRRASGTQQKVSSTLPRGKLQVISAPHLPQRAVPVRFLRSKGSVCLNQTLSPETHRICTRSCTSLMVNNKNTAVH